MVFNSVEEAEAYIEKQLQGACQSVADEMVDIAKRETQAQTQRGKGAPFYANTGNVINCIDATKISTKEVEITWQDNGGWYSVITGEPFYAPWALENGTVWYQSSTNFVDSSFSRIQSDIPPLLVSYLRARGIPIG